MSSKTKKPKRKSASSVVWFEVPADNPERAQKFYRTLFGWKIEKFPAMMDYWHIDTGGADATPDGGMLPRKHTQQPITVYISVDSASKFVTRVMKLGGQIMKPRTAVPHMGYFAICRDSENNEFALWERNENAK